MLVSCVLKVGNSCSQICLATIQHLVSNLFYLTMQKILGKSCCHQAATQFSVVAAAARILLYFWVLTIKNTSNDITPILRRGRQKGAGGWGSMVFFGAKNPVFVWPTIFFFCVVAIWGMVWFLLLSPPPQGQNLPLLLKKEDLAPQVLAGNVQHKKTPQRQSKR